MAPQSNNHLSKVKKSIAKIHRFIPLWQKLDGQDKQNLTLLIENKITSLIEYLRNTNMSPYVKLEGLLDLKTSLAATAFDAEPVKALITREVARIMTINGLDYKQKVFPLAPIGKRSLIYDQDTDLATSTPETSEEITDEETLVDGESIATRKFNVNCLRAGNRTVLPAKQRDYHKLYFQADSKQYYLDSMYCLWADIINALFHASNESRIVFMPIDGNRWWSLEMSSNEEAADFVADFTSRYEGMFGMSPS